MFMASGARKRKASCDPNIKNIKLQDMNIIKHEK
jgi:hypothetical protein